MKRFKFVIPIMVVVAILAMWLLNKDHSGVPLQSRIMIAFGGSILSGIITYFLLKDDVQKVDPKPIDNKKKR